MTARSLFDKVWDSHIVTPESDDHPAILYVDLHLIHEVTSPQAFAELRAAAPARYRVPAMQRLHAPLPRTALGKIRRRALAESRLSRRQRPLPMRRWST